MREHVALRAEPRRTSVLRRCGAHPCPSSGCIHHDEDRPLLRSSFGGVLEGERAPSIVREVLDSPGHPLEPETRIPMEAALGHDFSRIRVHHDARAGASALAVQAHAYTVGTDVVFAPGRYAPHSAEGHRLLGHELVHTIQQDGAPRGGPITVGEAHAPEEAAATSASANLGSAATARGDRGVLRRMALGTDTKPDWSEGLTLVPVPREERSRVLAAIERIRRVVDDPEGYPNCHDYFRDKCTEGEARGLNAAFYRAKVWKATGEPASGAYGVTLYAGSDEMAYTPRGYGQGEEGLAGTLLHELMHTCGVGGTGHFHAEVARLYCLGGIRNLYTMQFAVGGTEPVGILGYRRFLQDWADGRLALLGGFDVAPRGIAGEIDPKRYGEAPREFGGLMVGVRGRAGLWGGERFGGLTGRIEGGVGLGRYSLRGAERETGLGGGFVLQVGVGAEFYIPFFSTVIPLNVEAAVRYSQPLNPQAERIKTGVIGVGLEF